MARAASTDPLHNFRFHVKADQPQAGRADILLYDGGEAGEAGFTTCTIPDISADAVDYKEGIHLYTRKYPGIPVVGTVSMERGVMREDTTFFDWVMAGIAGGEYRADLTIYHWHRDGWEGSEDGSTVSISYEDARKYFCYQTVPTMVKPAADLSADAGDISLASLDAQPEYIGIEDAA